MNKKIAFISVLYNPSENSIINIALAKKHGFEPIVYLNKVDQATIDQISQFNVFQLGSNKNVGLAIAINETEQFIIGKGYSHLLYFDQDTIVKDEAWEKIGSTFAAITNQSADLGFIFYNSGWSTSSRLVINSGCLFPVSTLIKAGLHDKSYFVEGVDYEYCLRMKILGLKIVNVNCPGIDHGALQDYSNFIFFNRVFKIRVYGNARLSDFNRSHLRLIFKSVVNFEFEYVLFFVKSIIIFNAKEFLYRFLKGLS